MTENERAHETQRTVSGCFTNKIAIITGASRGIGAAVAHLFAQEGATVVLAVRSEEALAGLVNEITANGGNAIAVKTDVSNAVSMEALVKHTVERYGKLDLAVNNAGIAGGNTSLAQVSEELFDRIIAVNLKGTFLALKYELAAMQASGGGAIVNVSSTVGLVGNGAGIAIHRQ